MKKVKVSEATNTQLDWLVAKCAVAQGGFPVYMRWYTDGRQDTPHWGESGSSEYFRPTRRGDHMMPIIEREGIGVKRIRPVEHYGRFYTHAVWEAETRRQNGIREQYQLGPTPLIAAARCYVASKLGETVEVPDELA